MRSRRPLPIRHVPLIVLLAIAPTALPGCSASDNAEPAATAAKPASSAEIAKQHVDAANRLLGEGENAAAVEEFTAALDAVRRGGGESIPQVVDASIDAGVLFQRGSAYLAMGFPDTAAADFTEVLRLRPDDGAAMAKRAQAYVQLGDLYKAVRDATDAIRHLTENAAAHRYRGEAYLMRGQFDRAVADLQRAESLEPALAGEIRPLLAKAYLNWSLQLARSDDPAAAEEKLAKARELDAVLVAAAEAPATSDRGDENDAVTRTSAKQVVDEAQELFDAATALFELGRYEEALAEFTAAIAARRDFTDAYLRRGETLLALGFPDTAVKDFEQAVHYGGDSPKAYRLLAGAYLELGSPHRAALSATDALHADPLDAPSYVLRGTAYIELGNLDRAIADLEQAVRLDASRADDVKPLLDRAHRLRAAAQAGDEELDTSPVS